jgi:hypothetical protein
MRTVAHDDVFALAHNAETSLFQRLHRPEMINAGNFRHLLDRHFHFAHVGTTKALVHGGKIILMASRMFCIASCSVSPCDQQPGSAGQVTA